VRVHVWHLERRMKHICVFAVVRGAMRSLV
jgi:hypothetical protein